MDLQTNPSRAKGAVKEMLSSEQGAALVLVMLTVVVMTILGMVLMEVLRASNTQVSASEASVQAEAIAQKGLDESISLIREAMSRVNNNALFPRARDKMIEANRVINSLKLATNKSNIHALKGTYDITSKWTSFRTDVSNLANFPIPLTNPDAPYVEEIIVTSVGKIQPETAPNHTVTKVMKIYISTINPVFRYPVSSSKDLTLNGSPYIIGDVAAGGALTTSKIADYIGLLGNSLLLTSLPTNLPAIKGFIKAGSYNGNKDWAPTYFKRNYFPFEDTSMSLYKDIEVSQYVGNEIGLMNTVETIPLSEYSSIAEGSLIGPELGAPQEPSLPRGTKITDHWATISGDLHIAGSLAIINGMLASKSSGENPLATLQPKVILTGGSLFVKTSDPSLVAADLWGSLELDKGQRAVIQGNVALNAGFTMTGNMYIQGNLKIIGSINIDGTLYVDGTVDLKEMESINAAIGKPLIIAASGAFDFSDNKILDDEASRLKAFLYTQANMNLYSISSKLEITGGIHGRNVKLSALSEDSSKLSSIAIPEVGTLNLTAAQADLLPNQSKLKVFYDETLYSDPPQGIPTINYLDVYVKSITYDR